MDKRTNLTMKDKLQMASEGSDMPTVTYVTVKAIVFYISAAVTIVCMFLNWFPLDVDLAYLNLKDILGTVNVFTLPGALAEIKDGLNILGALLPNEVMDGISGAHFVSIALMIVAIASIGCFGVSVFFRLKANDRCVNVGRLGALLAAAVAIGFIALISTSLGSMLNAIRADDVAGNVMGIILSGPCSFTLIGSVIAAICAVMDMSFEEDVIIYHDGRMKIAKGPKWKCRCGRMNLSPLDRCYYCGKDRQ